MRVEDALPATSEPQLAWQLAAETREVAIEARRESSSEHGSVVPDHVGRAHKEIGEEEDGVTQQQEEDNHSQEEEEDCARVTVAAEASTKQEDQRAFQVPKRFRLTSTWFPADQIAINLSS